LEKLRRSYRFGRQSHHRNRLKLSTRLKPRKDIEPMKVTRKQLEEIIKEETEKILRGEPLETQLLQRALNPRDKMTPEKAKKLLPIKLHSDFDDYYAKNIELQKRGARSQEPEEVPGLEEETTRPLNKEDERICAGNPKCFKAHILPLFKDGKKFSEKTGQPLDVLKKAASAFWSEKAPGPNKTDSARSLGDKPQRYREDPKTGRMVPVDKADKEPQSSAPQVDEKELQSLAVKAYKIAKEKDPSWVEDIVDIYKLSKQKKIKKEKAMDLLNKIITKLPKLKEETTDETLDSGYFDQVKKTWKCPEGETMSSKSGKCEPNRVKPSLRQEQ